MIELSPPRWLLQFIDRRFVYKKMLVECLAARDGDQCFYCRHEFCRSSRRTIDHVIPLSRGGHTTFRNLVLACRWCNDHKGDQTRDQFERSQLLSKRRGDILQAKIIASRQRNAAEAEKRCAA